MTKKSYTVTRADLSDAVYREIGLSKAESAHLVSATLDKITDSLIAGENVKLAGFGSFIIRDKAQRTGRNPKTGKEVIIDPRRVVTFKASPMLNERVNSALTTTPN